MEFKEPRRCSFFSEIITFYIMFSCISVNGFTVTTTHTSTQYLSETENYTALFELGTDYCDDKYVCSDEFYQTFPDKMCHCDTLCTLLGDCCSNYVHETATHLQKEQFSCVQLNEIVKNMDFGVTMVTKCSAEWKHSSTKRLCEEKSPSDDIFLKLPVSDRSVLGVMFRNMYCAQCNFVYTFEYWNPQIKCVNETGVRSLPEMTDCDWFYIRPRPEVAFRTCQLKPPVITTCTESSNETFRGGYDNCTNGVYGIVYDESGKAYRNRNCAICNGIQTDLYCEQIQSSTPSNGSHTTQPKITYSFRLLVDFNEGTVSQNDEISDLHICNDSEKYDSFSQKCREIFCAPPSKPIKGSCVRSNGTYILPENCTLVKLDPSEYNFTDTSELWVFANNKIYSDEEFQMIGPDVFICLQEMQKCLHDCGEQDNLVESYLTLIGLILSIVSLAITLAIYIMFPQLLNIPGKILVCLTISLLLAQLFFLLSAEFERVSKLCLSVAVLVHYFYLAAFCWMNVIAFDMWRTFSNRYVSYGSRHNSRRFLKYNFYGWITPLLIVTPAVVLDFVQFDDTYKSLKPGYGKGVCWISSKNALILFFAGPLALFKFFDVVSFIFTVVHIARARQQGAVATKKNTCSFFINLKLSLIMGLTWVFAFVANFSNETVMWYLFIIFNCLQGLFIAICFLCTKKVCRLLSDRCKTVSSKSSSGTRLTSLS